MLQSIKCFLGLHKFEVVKSQHYNLTQDNNVVGNMELEIKLCKHCDHAEFDIKKIRFNGQIRANSK